MSPGVPHMGYTYFNLLDSPELLQILMTLTTVIKPLLPNFLGRAIVILNFVRRSLKTLLQQGISEPEFYGDLVYRFRKIVGKSNFSGQFRKLINRYKRIGYSLHIMRLHALLSAQSLLMAMLHSLISRGPHSMTVSS